METISYKIFRILKVIHSSVREACFCFILTLSVMSSCVSVNLCLHKCVASLRHTYCWSMYTKLTNGIVYQGCETFEYTRIATTSVIHSINDTLIQSIMQNLYLCCSIIHHDISCSKSTAFHGKLISHFYASEYSHGKFISRSRLL